MNKRLVLGLLGWGIVTGAWGSGPPLTILDFAVSSNVASGSALHLAVDRPELNGLTTTGSVRMVLSNNQWRAKVAVQGSTVATQVAYRLTARTTSSGTYCAADNGNLSGTAHTTNAPLWNPGYSGKTVYYHSTWTNVTVFHRVGETETWQHSAVMTDVGAGRSGNERRYQVTGVGEPGRALEFVMHGYAGGVEQWDNPAVGGINNNYHTWLDALFVQDGNIFNYVPPATVSAPQVISVNKWSSSYTGNGIPSRGGRIYLPRGYTQNSAKRYPVLYMHDGQNVFDPGGSFGSWSADAAATREITQGRMRETIIVAVNNTTNRMDEYGTPEDGHTGHYYLLYLVNNVKPNIDANYRTLTDLMNTGNMGSSLGGLIAAYIGLKTNVFGLIGAVSPSYWYASDFRNWIQSSATKGRRIWQDCGTNEGAGMWDHFWPVYGYYLQDGYVVGDDIRIAVGCGHEHNEWAWSQRVGAAFQYLYNPWDEPNTLLEATPVEGPGSLQFTTAATNVAENAGTVRVAVSRVGGASGAASVNYATANGTASAGADYTAQSGTLNWADQENSTRHVDIPILDDAGYEGAEVFYVNLSGVTGATLGQPATVAVTIQDNELPPPQLVITNPVNPLAVGGEVTTYTVQGTLVVSNWQGMFWSNSLSGQSAVIPLANAWQAVNVPLQPGINVITVTATNTQAAMEPIAEDAASNATYSDGWSTGQNGGSGFGAWSLANNPEAGFFTSENGWGLWSHTNNLAEAIRPFAVPLTAGQQFQATIQNGWVLEGMQGVGMMLRNQQGADAIQFYFNGGDVEYQVQDAQAGRGSGIPWTDMPQTVTITLLTTNTYELRVGSAVFSGTCNGPLVAARWWNWNGGEGPNYDFSFDHLRVFSPTSSLVSTSAVVTIMRLASAVPNISNVQLQGGEAGGLNLSLQTNQPGATYWLWESPTLFPSSNWQKVEDSGQLGTGGAIELSVTNMLLPRNFYRVGME